MGNACQASPASVQDPYSREEVQLHLGKQCKPEIVECLLSQNTICCLDDESEEPGNYRRLEADCGRTDRSRAPTRKGQISQFQDVRSHGCSQGALKLIAKTGSPCKVACDQEPRRILRRSGKVCRSSLCLDMPAAPTLAREDVAERENVPLEQPRSCPKLQPSLKRALALRRGADVHVHLYDLSNAFAQLNSVALDLFGYGGALHVGVEVFGVEWSFGTGGVSLSTPKCNRFYAYRQTLPMGRTTLSHVDVERIIVDMHTEWPGSEYDLFSKNCGTFCNAFCMRLGVGSLPTWVTRLAEDSAKSQTVRQLADMLTRHGFIGDGGSSAHTTPQVSQNNSRFESSAGSPQVQRARSCSDCSLSQSSTPRHEDLLEGLIPGMDRDMLVRSFSESFSTCSSPARKRVDIDSFSQNLIPSPVRRMRRAVAAAAGGA